MLSYHIKIHKAAHNDHDPSWSSSKHIIHRRRNPLAKNFIHAQITADVPPKDILTGLRQAGIANVTTRDMYNRKRTQRKWELNGDTLIEALMRILQDDSKYFFSFKTDSKDCITHLFFAFNEAVEIVQSNPDIVMAELHIQNKPLQTTSSSFSWCC
jgi:hypothetical protein